MTQTIQTLLTNRSILFREVRNIMQEQSDRITPGNRIDRFTEEVLAELSARQLQALLEKAHERLQGERAA